MRATAHDKSDNDGDSDYNAIVFKKFQQLVSMDLCFGNDKNALNPNP